MSKKIEEKKVVCTLKGGKKGKSESLEITKSEWKAIKGAVGVVVRWGAVVAALAALPWVLAGYVAYLNMVGDAVITWIK